jgi:hypothetical protein
VGASWEVVVMADKGNSESDTSKAAAKSLNEQNWPGLLAITALNVIVFAVMIGIAAAPPSKLAVAWAFLLPAGVGLAMIRVLNGLISGKNKNRLVFWKWDSALPGSEAYSVHAQNDERFDYKDVKAKICHDSNMTEEQYEEFLGNARAQNTHWYNKVYYPTQDRPAVQQSNRNFLFTRDFAAISFVLLIAFGVVASLVIFLNGYFVADKNSFGLWMLYCVGLIFQYVLVRWAARNYAIETVNNAIAAWFHQPKPPLSPTT